MKKQRILSALLALCIVFTLVPTALAAKADDFTDVSRSDWFYNYVDYVSSKGYFRGTTETTFSPQRNMTRAMFVVVLSRFDGAKGDSSQSAFTDVAPGAWCTAAINWAAANKIVEGKGDGTFAPDAPITRAQMCAIINRYLNYYKKGNKVTLSQTGSVSAMSDQNTVPSYAVDAVKQCQRYGLINGFKDGTFRPNALSTRAHVAAVIYRMADLVKHAKAENTSGGGSSGGGSSSTTIDPNDRIGNAVLASIKQVNDGFTEMKSNVISAIDKVNSENNFLNSDQLQKVKDAVNAMVRIDDVKADFTSGDAKDPRQVIWNVALNVKEGQAVSVIDQASKIANALVSGSVPSKPTPDDIDGFLASVKAAVESETGIVLSKQSLSEIKTQVVNKLKTEGKSLWANFHDGKGNYVCDDVTVNFKDKTYTIKVDDGNTTLEGSKSQIAKELSTAIAHEIYKQLKDQGTNGYTSQLKFTIGVNMNFAPSANPEIAAKTAKYANDYQVTVVVNLDSDGLIEYKYEGNENYLCLNVTKDIQTAYNKGLDQIAEQIALNDGETQDKVVAKAKEGIKTEIPALYDEVQTALAKYDIKLSTTREDLEKALMPVVESWVKTNWTTIVDTTISGGTLADLDNDLLINAVWPLIEKDIDALDVDALIQTQISEKLTEKGFDEAWIVNEANENDDIKTAKSFCAAAPSYSIDPAGVTLDFKSVNDINFLIQQETITITFTDYIIKSIPIDGTKLKKEIVTLATKKLDSALTSSPTLKDMLEKNPDLKDYLIYSALVKLGLDFKTEKAAAAKDGAVLKNLVSTIKIEGKAKLDTKLNDKLSAIDVSEILNDGSAENADARKKIKLLNSLKFDADGIQTKTAKELADALKSQTMMDIVGDKGNKYVDQYLEKIVNKVQTLLPDSASVTLNNVKLDENALNAFRSAKTTKAAVTELANLIEKFGDLSINSFADPAGQVMTVSCKGRTASAHLVIDVE